MTRPPGMLFGALKGLATAIEGRRKFYGNVGGTGQVFVWMVISGQADWYKDNLILIALIVSSRTELLCTWCFLKRLALHLMGRAVGETCHLPVKIAGQDLHSILWIRFNLSRMIIHWARRSTLEGPTVLLVWNTSCTEVYLVVPLNRIGLPEQRSIACAGWGKAFLDWHC
jgi:hypothetical protein